MRLSLLLVLSLPCQALAQETTSPVPAEPEPIVVPAEAVPAPSDAASSEPVAASPEAASPEPAVPTEVAGTAAAAGPEPSRKWCKPDEKPKAEKDLAAGEVVCVELKAHICAPEEKPLPKEQLADGELSCIEGEVERAVPFFKGELTRLGDAQLTNNRGSFGFGLGLAAIDNIFFAQLRPDINILFGPVSIGLGAPLRFEVANLGAFDLANIAGAGEVFGNVGRFRIEDWDQVEDFLRPLRSLTYGRKEDHLYIDIGRVHSVTLGHGQLVRRYTPNVDIDEDRLMAAVDGYGDIGGFELLAGPFPIPRLLGALLFVKPLGIFSEDVMAKSWSLGVTYVTDLNAPTTLERRLNPADQRVQLAVDSTNQLVWPDSNAAVAQVVQGVGIDTELKVLKMEGLDIKTYLDYSHLYFPADTAEGFGEFDGGGYTLGVLLRANLGATPVRDFEDENEDVRAGRVHRDMKATHAVRLRLEGRSFDAAFLPSYFNTSYEIDRLQYGITQRAQRATLPTKIGFVSSQAAEDRRLGYYAELSYAWVDAIGFTVVYENPTVLSESGVTASARNFALHVETSGLDFLQFFATYHCRNFETFDQVFTFNSDNEVVFAGVRWQPLPIMFINLAVQRSFRIGFEEDDLADGLDKDDLRFTSIGFENVTSGSLDVELGWQF